MIDLFSMVFKYFNAWLLMGFALGAAIVTEKLYLLLVSAVQRKRMGGVCVPRRGLRAIFRLEIGLPPSISPFTAHRWR